VIKYELQAVRESMVRGERSSWMEGDSDDKMRVTAAEAGLSGGVESVAYY